MFYLEDEYIDLTMNDYLQEDALFLMADEEKEKAMFEFSGFTSTSCIKEGTLPFLNQARQKG